MADLEQALDRILADPEAMAQIMDLANRLGGGEPVSETASDGPASSEDLSPPEAAVLPEADRLAPLLALLRSGGGSDPRSEALLNALRPYLSEARRRKLDRAVRLSGLARTARSALDLWKEGKLSV